MSGARWRECLDVETADRPFLEFERRSNREQAGGQLANGGLMSDERNPLTCPVAAKLLDDLGGRAARRQGAGGRDRRLAGLRHDLSGLPGAHERARQYLVEADIQGLECCDRSSQARHALAGQGPLGVVRPGVAALLCEPVPNQV